MIDGGLWWFEAGKVIASCARRNALSCICKNMEMRKEQIWKWGRCEYGNQMFLHCFWCFTGVQPFISEHYTHHNLQCSLRKFCRKPYFKKLTCNALSAIIAGVTLLGNMQHLLRKLCRKLTTVKNITIVATIKTCLNYFFLIFKK